MVEESQKSADKKPSVFLDSNVIILHFSGHGDAGHIFDPEIQNKYNYAIDGVILQELMLLAENIEPNRISELIQNNKIKVLDIDLKKAEETMLKVRHPENVHLYRVAALAYRKASRMERVRGLTANPHVTLRAAALAVPQVSPHLNGPKNGLGDFVFRNEVFEALH